MSEQSRNLYLAVAASPAFGFSDLSVKYMLVRTPFSEALGLCDRLYSDRERASAWAFSENSYEPVPFVTRAVFLSYDDGDWTVEAEDCRESRGFYARGDERVFLGWVSVPETPDPVFSFEKDFVRALEKALAEAVPEPDAGLLESSTYEAVFGRPCEPLEDCGYQPFYGAEPKEALLEMLDVLYEALKARGCTYDGSDSEKAGARVELALAAKLLTSCRLSDEHADEIYGYRLGNLRWAYRAMQKYPELFS